MKARQLAVLVFAATLGLHGPVAARGFVAGAPEPEQEPPIAPAPPADLPPGAGTVRIQAPAGVVSAGAQDAPAPKAGPAIQGGPPATQGTAPRHLTQLSKKEMAERIKALPEEERQWLEVYVAPIILPEEKNLFVQLTEPHQREIFKEEFWKRREQQGLPEPLGPGYRNRYEGFREAAETTYGGINSDTGRMVVLRGEPAGIQEFLDCNNVFRDLAVWTYAQTGGVSGFHRDVQYLFYRPSSSSGPWRLWLPMLPDKEILLPTSCLNTIAEACRQAGTPGTPSNDTFCPRNAVPQTCDAACAIVAHRPEHPPDRGRPRGRRDLRAARRSTSKASRSSPSSSPRSATRRPSRSRRRPVGLDGGRTAGDAPGHGRRGGGPRVPVRQGHRPDADGPGPDPPQALEQGDPAADRGARRRSTRTSSSSSRSSSPTKSARSSSRSSEDYQKDKFIDAFWKRRTIDAQGIRTDYRAVYTQRVEQAHRAVPQPPQRPGEDVRHQRAARRGHPDRLPGHLRADADLVLRAARGPEEQGLPHLLRSPTASAPYKLWLPHRRRRRPARGRRHRQATGARVPDVTRCFEWRSVQQAIQYTHRAARRRGLRPCRRRASSSSRPWSRPRASTRSSR